MVNIHAQTFTWGSKEQVKNSGLMYNRKGFQNQIKPKRFFSFCKHIVEKNSPEKEPHMHFQIG